jgi:hypothetical protein
MAHSCVRDVEALVVRRRLPPVSLAVDVMHLIVIATGVGIGAWVLIALRRSLPRGRFLVFGAASAGAIFGCAALAGEVGLAPPAAWFAAVMAAMFATAVIAIRSSRAHIRTA